MNSKQLKFLSKHDLGVAYIQSNYELNTFIDLNQIKLKCQEQNITYCTRKSYISFVIVRNTRRYSIDIYSDGKLNILRAKEPLLIYELVSETVRIFKIKLEKDLNIDEMKIIKLRCEGRINHNVNINHVLFDVSMKSIESIENTDSFRIHYNFGSVCIIPRYGIIISCETYSQFMHIYIHIHSILPIVLELLNNNPNSIWSFMPKDIIYRILYPIDFLL
jgi:TATA-box binding protein (TBP) (component of TFIID and TFIIIB)